jgi:hypothetical protein
LDWKSLLDFCINRNFRILFICVNIRSWERIFKFHSKSARMKCFWKFFEILSARKRWIVFNEFGLNMLLFLRWNSISGYRSKATIFWFSLFVLRITWIPPIRFDIINNKNAIMRCTIIFLCSYILRFLWQIYYRFLFGWFITLSQATSLELSKQFGRLLSFTGRFI